MSKEGSQITVAEIANAESLHPAYVLQVLRGRDAPLPVRKIGNSKLYDTASVAKFFLERRERIAKQFPKRAKKRRKAA